MALLAGFLTGAKEAFNFGIKMVSTDTLLSMATLITLDFTPGNWKDSAPISTSNLDRREIRLEGHEKGEFLRFLQRMLRWDPEERPSAKELLFDPWLMRGLIK